MERQYLHQQQQTQTQRNLKIENDINNNAVI
jgi:hypothetical protein